MFSLGHIQSVFYNYLVVVVRQEHEVCDQGHCRRAYTATAREEAAGVRRVTTKSLFPVQHRVLMFLQPAC